MFLLWWNGGAEAVKRRGLRYCQEGRESPAVYIHRMFQKNSSDTHQPVIEMDLQHVGKVSYIVNRLSSFCRTGVHKPIHSSKPDPNVPQRFHHENRPHLSKKTQKRKVQRPFIAMSSFPHASTLTNKQFPDVQPSKRDHKPCQYITMLLTPQTLPNGTWNVEPWNLLR